MAFTASGEIAGKRLVTDPASDPQIPHMACPGSRARHDGGSHACVGGRVRPASEQLTQPGGLAERLAGLRSAAGLKAVQLAESLGWARSKISKIENGNQVPSAR